MFGISFSELAVILIVALVVVGPQKLPQTLGTIGAYIGKLRRIATDMRRQTGIDELLRQEGLEGGLNELRSMMRQDFRPLPRANHGDPYGDLLPYDRSREYPVEGCDAYAAIPEDLLDEVVDDHGAVENAAKQTPKQPDDQAAPAQTKASV